MTEVITAARLAGAVLYSTIAGIVNGAIAAAGSSSFAQQLTISLVTGLISFSGIVIAAIIAARSSRDSRELAETNANILASHTQKLATIERAASTAAARTDKIDKKCEQHSDEQQDAQAQTDATLENEREAK